jgi:hypothetical protein
LQMDPKHKLILNTSLNSRGETIRIVRACIH